MTPAAAQQHRNWNSTFAFEASEEENKVVTQRATAEGEETASASCRVPGGQRSQDQAAGSSAVSSESLKQMETCSVQSREEKLLL